MFYVYFAKTFGLGIILGSAIKYYEGRDVDMGNLKRELRLTRMLSV